MTNVIIQLLFNQVYQKSLQPSITTYTELQKRYTKSGTCVYSITYVWGYIYIGETLRSVGVRKREHQHYSRLGDKPCHWNNTKIHFVKRILNATIKKGYLHNIKRRRNVYLSSIELDLAWYDTLTTKYTYILIYNTKVHQSKMTIIAVFFYL